MSWDEYLMGFAKHAAIKSKDSTQVGAALVDDDHTVVLTGFNGPPRGVYDKPDRFERPDKYMFASHAEANLVAFAARYGINTDKKTVYCTHFPCAACARTMIQAGIKRVVYGDGTFQALAAEETAVRMMCEEAGVALKQYG